MKKANLFFLITMLVIGCVLSVVFYRDAPEMIMQK